MTIADRFIRTFEPQIAAVLGAVRRAEQHLGPEDDWVENDRRVLFQLGQPIFGALGRDTVSRVLSDDYITTVNVDPDTVELVLDGADYQRNLLSTRKYRDHHDGGRQWAVGSWVLDPPDTDWQHHVCLFEARDGGTEVYAHSEASVTEPTEHDGGDLLISGDPRNLEAIFNRNEIVFNNDRRSN